MEVLHSRLDTRSEGYQSNRTAMLEKLAYIETQLARAGGGERSIARHRTRGKLLVRERIELLPTTRPSLN